MHQSYQCNTRKTFLMEWAWTNRKTLAASCFLKGHSISFTLNRETSRRMWGKSRRPSRWRMRESSVLSLNRNSLPKITGATTEEESETWVLFKGARCSIRRERISLGTPVTTTVLHIQRERSTHSDLRLMSRALRWWSRRVLIDRLFKCSIMMLRGELEKDLCSLKNNGNLLIKSYLHSESRRD